MDLGITTSNRKIVRTSAVLLTIACLAFLLSSCQTPNNSVKNPLVRLNTELGSIDIELYAEAAPITAANFLAYVDAGLYSSTQSSDATFYRTVRGDNQRQNNINISVIQGGLMDAGFEKPVNSLPAVAHETTEMTGVLHEDGVLSLARAEPGTGSSEFFICVGGQPSLDFGGQRNPDGQGFAAFGKVVRGMDVVRKIHQARTIQSDGDQLSYTSGQIIQKPIGILSSERLKSVQKQ